MLKVRERFVSDSDIKTLYQNKEIRLQADTTPVNAHIILRSEVDTKRTAVVRHIGEGKYIAVTNHGKINIGNISPRDAHQLSFMDSLLNESILINVGVGSAGTGKTTMALAYALDQFLYHQKTIHLTKPTTFVGSGNAFGPVPGDISEKFDPYLESYYIILEKMIDKRDSYQFKQMKQNGDLKFTPIALARGCTYDNATFIIDEAQNLSWHELNSIISRMGENTKCIILGDLKQIDIDTPEEEVGLYQLLHSQVYQQSAITSGIELTTQYRSPITQLVADVHEELRQQQKEKRQSS